MTVHLSLSFRLEVKDKTDSRIPQTINAATKMFFDVDDGKWENIDAYFKKVNPSNIVDEEATRSYFSTSMPTVTVRENEVFVLVDQWWRGIDSKAYGPLPTEQIIGLVKGYAQ